RGFCLFVGGGVSDSRRVFIAATAVWQLVTWEGFHTATCDLFSLVFVFPFALFALRRTITAVYTRLAAFAFAFAWYFVIT
uniref:Uncharacterized protein n=1 Tax=Aegilops tauschii subsp. strangulata TaxID=200361 RepID=A0A453F0G2_AEGTS